MIEALIILSVPVMSVGLGWIYSGFGADYHPAYDNIP